MTSETVCRFCAERIPDDAQVCRLCGERQQALQPRPVPSDWRLKTGAALQISLGAITGLMAPCMVFGMIMQASMPQLQQQAQAQLGAQIAGVAFYVLIAAFFVVTGAGAWKGKRWVRPIMLSIMAPCLLLGLVASVAGLYLFPTMSKLMEGMFQQLRQQGGQALPSMGSLTTITLAVTGVVMILIYVGIPGVFTALYWSPKIQKTCDQLDKAPRWTDGRPLPMVGLTLWLGLVAVSSVMIPAYGVAPAFGILLTGWQAGIFAVLLCAVTAGLCVAVHKRHPAAWWGCLVLVVALGLSQTLTFTQVDVIEVYRAMGTPDQQMEVLESLDLSALNHVAIGSGALLLVAGAGFLVYVRRFFVAG